MPPSSTSSSEARGGFPWAGLTALVLVVILDRVAFSQPELWDWAKERIPRSETMEHGVAGDRIGHLELAAAEPARPHVVLAGNSRVNRGLVYPILWRRGLGEQGTLTKMAHGGVRPYELACMLDELALHKPDVVVTVVTEFETHRPVQFLTQMGSGRVTPYLDLLDQLEPDVLLSGRDGLLGLGLATQLDAYRFRRQMGAALLDDYRRFPKLKGGGRPSFSDVPAHVTGEPPLPMKMAPTLAIFKKALPEAPLVIVRRQVEQVHSVTLGDHARLQQALLERAFDRLVEAGTDILLIESPTHPEAVKLYDPAAREDARAWAARLAEHPQIHWFSEAQIGELPEDRWADLTHLSRTASDRLSNLTGVRVAAILAHRAERDAR